MVAARECESGVSALFQRGEMLRVQRMEIGMRDVHAGSLACARLCRATRACGSSLFSSPAEMLFSSPSGEALRWGWCCGRATVRSDHHPHPTLPRRGGLEGELRLKEGLEANYGAVS